MKINIKKVAYNKLTDRKDWWTWKEICDDCHAVIREFGEYLSSRKPDTLPDFCLKCLKKKFKINP